MTMPAQLEVGDVLFLKHSVAGIPYPTGIYALRVLTEASVIVSLVSSDAAGLYAVDNAYAISAEDLPAFTATGAKARIGNA